MWIIIRSERFPEPHPLCECPELTFANGAEVSAANAACRERSGGITHYIITKEDLDQLKALLDDNGL